MELVNRGGQSFFVPVSEHEVSGITSFNKWEQAFRIFMNIYTQAFPGCSSELLQYNHIIYTTSTTYHWDNVYMYDKEFRVHMSHFPNRSWAIILQQAWTMYLKDRIKSSDTIYRGNGHNGQHKRKKEAC